MRKLVDWLAPKPGMGPNEDVLERSGYKKLAVAGSALLLIVLNLSVTRPALADMRLTEEGFGRMTRMLAEVSQRHCQGRIVSILEGGYNLRALGRSVVAHLRALAAD